MSPAAQANVAPTGRIARSLEPRAALAFGSLARGYILSPLRGDATAQPFHDDAGERTCSFVHMEHSKGTGH